MGQLADLFRFAQLFDFTFQLLDALLVSGRRPVALTGIPFVPAYPREQCLRRTTKLGGDGLIAAHCDGRSNRLSATMRTVRS